MNGDHDHEFRVEMEFIKTQNDANKFAANLQRRLNSGWSTTGLSYQDVGGQALTLVILIRDVERKEQAHGHHHDA